MVTSTVSRLGRAPEEGIKAPCKSSTTGPITLSGTGQVLNGITMNTSDRALVKDQVLPAENGIFIVGPNAWERATDMNADNDVVNGQLVADANTGQLYKITATSPWTPGATPITFVSYAIVMPPSIVLTSNAAVDLVDVDTPLVVGSLTPLVSQHLEFDFQSMQSKSDATTAAPLFLNPLGSYVQVPQIVAGDPGTEQAGIVISGVTYQSALKTSDIGGTNVAAFIVHRHSTTLPPVIVGSRTNSDDATHAVVADNDTLLSIMAVGYDGAEYEQGGQIRFQVDGVPGVNDMPGRITFLTTPAAAVIPVERMRIDAAGLVSVLFGFDVTGNIAVSGTVDSRDVAADGTAQDTHIADATLHFTQAAISITESQISDLQAYLTAEVNDLSAAVTWANIPDANVPASAVTQHQAALSITESQISDLGSYSLVGHIHAPVTSTTAALAAIGNAINTTADKVAGYEVFNTTTGLPVWAVGAADGDVWNDATGATAHTPV